MTVSQGGENKSIFRPNKGLEIASLLLSPLIKLATLTAPTSEDLGWSGSPRWSGGTAQSLLWVLFSCEVTVPAQAKDVLNHDGHGANTKATDGRRAAEMAVPGGGGKGQ